MGLSAFNAMRARMKAEAKAMGNAEASVKVEESKPVENPVVKDNLTTEKKTDAEKLKKGKRG